MHLTFHRRHQLIKVEECLLPPNAITPPPLLKNVSKPKSFDQAVTAEGKLDKEIAEKASRLSLNVQVNSPTK